MTKNKEKLNNICPMTFSREDGPYDCYRERCAWWKDYYRCVLESIKESLSDIDKSIKYKR